jgi:hypothetical protein
VISDELNTLVTNAIVHAEEQELGSDDSKRAWAMVSSLEEKLAVATPISSPEGRLARRGAILAALKAEEYGRSNELAENYPALIWEDCFYEYLDKRRE